MRPMRVPASELPRRSTGPRLWIIVLAVALLILMTSARGLALFYTDFLWFKEVGFDDTWRSLLAAKAVPALVFGVLFFALMLANLVIADRLAPKRRPMGPEDEIVEHYRAYVAPYAGRLRVGVAAFFALVFGAPVSAQWREWILFRNGVDFGVEDPQFHRDVGFYVFRLPFLEFVAGWVFAALLATLMVTAVFHYVNGGIRLRIPFQLVTPQVKAHLSVILALMAFAKTAQYWLGRFELTFSTRGAVHGASYTDVKAQLPAINFLMIISVAAAVLFIGNIFRRGWVLPVIAVGLWGFIWIVVGAAYPAFIQRIQVQPNEPVKERPYIERNIDATRAAWGIDEEHVRVESFAYSEDVDAERVRDYSGTLDHIRLWDPPRLVESFEALEELKAFYSFEDLDFDRYTVGDERVPVLTGVRELDDSGLPSPSWANRHITYTHGYGAVIAEADAVATGDAPSFLASGIPPGGEIEVTRAETYFGENLGGFAIVGAKSDEYQPVNEDGEAADGATRYEGTGGVRTSSFLRKAALALRFGSWDLFVSGQVTSDSRIVYVRDVRERVAKAAPFLRFDADPYPVVLDGRVVWVLDGYTVTDRYPYSQRLHPRDLPAGSGLDISMNYVRNSVKAVVDAYDGNVTFYVVDDEDPILRAYRKAFPELFTDDSEVPAGLREHFRYPEDLFRAQSEQYTKYHVTDPPDFYRGSAQWLLSPRPGERAAESGDGAAPSATTTSAGESTPARDGEFITPVYLMMQLPGETEPEFVLTRPFVPFSSNHSKDNQLAGFLVARSDAGENYGELVAYETPESSDVPSPLKAANQIDGDKDISARFTLLDAAGSSVIRGNVQLIPLGDAIIYVRPIYVRGGGGEGAFARFKFVAMTYGEKSVLATSVDEGVRLLFGGEEPDTGEPDTGEPDTGEPDTATVAELLARAEDEFAAADEALREGDWTAYGEHIAEAERLVARATRLLADGGAPGEDTSEGDGAAPTSTAPTSAPPET